MYGADISAGLVFQVTSSVIEKVVVWRKRAVGYVDIRE